MKTTPSVFVLLAAVLPAVLSGQSFHLVSKSRSFLQTAATAPAPDPAAPFSFRARSAAAATLTGPGSVARALVPDTHDGGFFHFQAFATQAALDAAFPDGLYRLAGAGIPALSLPLGPDLYPETTPRLASVANGTWSGGVLVVNPSLPVTLNFSEFSGYAASGVAGHINFYLGGVTDPGSDRVTLETEVTSRSLFGSTAQPAPLTAYTVPAGRLVAGRVYRVWLDYDTVATLDTAVFPGNAVATLYSKTVSFYIGAQHPAQPVAPPVVTAPPVGRAAVLGGSVSLGCAFTVGGGFPSNNLPLVISWTHNGRELDLGSAGGKYTVTGGPGGAPGTTLTVNALAAADAGDYVLTLATAGGLVVTAPATLTLAAPAAPVIVAAPRSATVNAGSTVALTVTASGTPTPAFQWRKDGQPIAGATADTLLLPGITAAAAGAYTVSASNSVATVTSAAAVLTVTAGQPSRLPNLSVRTNLGAGQTLFVGFATLGPKTMLLRGIGPTLGAFGLTGVLPDPTVALYDSASAKIDENNDWLPALAPVFAEVGAFALTAGSKDAVLRRSCNGAHTAQLRSPGSGVVLVEVYDSGGTGQLVNVSARNVVGTGDNILIAGFVVDGLAAKTLLIRGVGARLADFGVTGVLADPKLEIYNTAGTKIAENDSWAAALQPVARAVGAFDLALGSRDAALLLTLAPGAYTAQVSGATGGTGEALVEVYEVP